MTWMELYGKDNAPTDEQIATYVDSPLWAAINGYLADAYDAAPKHAFSGCSGQPGWNVKYAKGGKALCTLYPMPGSFIALVVIGERERTEAELLLPACTPYVQALYAQAGALMGAKWMMIHVTDADILADVKRLIALRRKPRAAA